MKKLIVLMSFSIVLLTACSKEETVDQLVEQTSEMVLVLNNDNNGTAWDEMEVNTSEMNAIEDEDLRMGRGNHIDGKYTGFGGTTTIKFNGTVNGGGLHEIKKGGILKIHTDFNKHPNLDLDRRVNVLIYLNKKWEKDYGGNLELWDRNMKSCDKKILPIFNTMVIFSTNDFSNHGHPQPVICPSNISRKSIALYYFSKGRPKEELNDVNIKNKTYFKNRSGFIEETGTKKDKFKNVLRKFKLYKMLKNFEKKFIRKKTKKTN